MQCDSQTFMPHVPLEEVSFSYILLFLLLRIRNRKWKQRKRIEIWKQRKQQMDGDTYIFSI